MAKIKKIDFGNNQKQFSKWYSIYTFLYHKKGILRQQGVLITLLIIFSSLLLFFNLGQRSLWEPDEGRYAEMSREMVESADWLTPRLNYIKHFDKPPLTYWLIGSSLKLFGPSEFIAHLPLVIVGVAGILATFFLGKALFGKRCAFLAACILISSLGYPAISRILSTDIIFTFLCLLCYLFFVQKRFLLFYLFMALGFMTKGPVVLLITIIPIGTFLIYTRKRQVFKEMRWGLGLLLFALVALPWFIYQASVNSGLLSDWFFQHTINRIVRPTKQPFYFFIPVAGAIFFPWSFFLIPALKRYLSFKKGPCDNKTTKTLLLFLWFFLPFLFFSCIGKKLVPYILPLLPAMAILTARIWNEAIDNPKILASKLFSASFFVFLSCSGILGLATLVALAINLDYKLGFALLRPNIIILSVIFGATTILAFWAFRLRKVMGLFWIIALSSALFFLSVVDVLPKIEASTSKSIKPLALKIKEDLRPEDQVVNYRCFLKSLPFYLSRRTIVVERERNLVYEEDPRAWEDYLLKDKEALYNLLRAKDIRVYCITYTWEFKKIKEEYLRPVYFLGQAGRYVLFTNKEARR